MQGRILTIVCWTLLFLLAAVSAIFPVSSGDVWWHIAAGDYILAHGTVPRHDLFSFSALGKPWVTHEWLFEVLLSLLFRLGGTTALILFRATLVLVTLALLLFVLRRLGVDTTLALPLLLISIPLLTFRAFVRPHVATETMFALYVSVLFPLITAGEHSRFRWPWLLIPVQLLWANLHSGAIFGPLLFLAAGAAALLLDRDRTATTSGIPPRLLATGAALAGISLLNPNGWRSLLYSLFLAGSRTLTSAITELWSPLRRHYWNSDFFVSLVLLSSIGLVSIALNRRRNPLLTLLFGAAAVAGLLALRNVPLFAILAVPIAGIHLNSLVQPKLKSRLYLPLLWLVALVSTALLARALTVGTRIPGGFRKPGLGIEERLFPVGAAEFIANNHRGGKVFNTMEYGGYLIWRLFPKFRVYVDGRLDVYGIRLLEQYRQALWSGPQFDSIVSEYDVDCVLLAYPPSLDANTERYLGRTLALRPDWSLVYWDDNSLVYLRNTEPNRRVIEGRRFSAIVPLLLWPDSATSPDANQLIAEASLAVSVAPGSSRAHAALGLALLRAGRWSEAARAFETALAIDPANLTAAQGKAMVASQRGDLEGTIAALRHLLRLAPQEPLAHYNLGYALLRRGDNAGARREFERTLRIDARIVPAHNALAELALTEGDTDQALKHTHAVLRLAPDNRYALSRLQRLRRYRPRVR